MKLQASKTSFARCFADRNIFVLGVVHARLGLMMAASFADSVMHHMQVGIGFLRFHP